MYEFTRTLKDQAHELGFVMSGVTVAAEPGRLERFHRWLDAGYAGRMHYLEARRQAYDHPHHVLDGCKTILMLAVPYASTHSDLDDQPSVGRVARYAQSWVDYHDVIHARLKSLKRWVLEHHANALVRGVIDTAPLLERELAEAAGLGWVGKNTLLLNRKWGSYFFLAAMLTDLELVADEPHDQSFCGTCTACLQACPTQAFPEPYVLDASRCISYLTIELRDMVPGQWRDQLDGWAFGCDVCQEVCPWNRWDHAVDPELEPRHGGLDLIELLNMTDESFRARFRRTAMWRSRRVGLLRNAILLAGTQRQESAIDPLKRLLLDPEPVLRASAAWALARLAPTDWREQLEHVRVHETDPQLRRALQELLDMSTADRPS